MGKVGYWMRQGKAKRIDVSKIRDILMRDYNLELVFLDPNSGPLPPVSAMFHKMSDLLFEAEDGDEQSVKDLDALQHYFNTNADIRVFDPIPSVKILLDRVSMYDAIQRCSNAIQQPEDKFYSCGYQFISEEQDQGQILTRLKESDISFPLICKSRIAQGSKGHDMSMVFNKEGLLDCKKGGIAVPFINHDAVLYKIFICGDYHKIIKRPSIRNFTSEESEGMDVYHFDSSTISKYYGTSSLQSQAKTDSTGTGDVSQHKDYNENDLEGVDTELVASWVKVFRHTLNLSIIGVDLIFESKTNKPYIIDVNYFPGYDGCENFHQSLADMLYNATPPSSQN